MVAFQISLGIIILILIVLIISCRKAKTDTARAIRQMMLLGILITLDIMIQCICKTELASRALFGLYFVLTDWMGFGIAKFALSYTNNGKYLKHINRLFPILIFDIFYMTVNTVRPFAFQVRRIHTFIGDVFKFESQLPFVVHMVIVYFLVLFGIVVFLIKTIRCSAIYRTKYLSILLVILGIVVLNAVVMFMGDTVDISVYGYGIGGILLWYFAMKFIPSELLNQTLSAVAMESNEGIFIMDETTCAYMNAKAKTCLEIIKKSDTEGIIDVENPDTIKIYFEKIFNNCENGQLYNHDFQTEDVSYFYQISHKGLWDKKNRKIGSSVVIYDRTIERREYEIQKYNATHDHLTDLYTREHFYEMVEERIKEEGIKYLLICSDITRFKLIIELFGVKIADEVLINT